MATTIKRNSKGQFAKGSVNAWNKGRSIGQSHHNWKGDKVSYEGLHMWVRRRLGDASRCDAEDGTCKGRFEWANIDGSYNRDLKLWMPLCISHHRRFDNKRRGYANNVKVTEVKT